MAFKPITSEMLTLKGYNGDVIEAYYAQPKGDGPFPGVVVCHHGPGWDAWTGEVVMKLALHGYAAISPHVYDHFGTHEPDEAAAASAPPAACRTTRCRPTCRRASTTCARCRSTTARSASSASAPAGASATSAPRSSRTSTRRSIAGAAASSPTTRRADAGASRGADRVHEGHLGAAAGHLRQRRRQPGPGPGQPHRGDAQGRGQDVRVPPLRRRRPRLLRRRPPGLPPRAGDRRAGRRSSRSTRSTSARRPERSSDRFDSDAVPPAGRGRCSSMAPRRE